MLSVVRCIVGFVVGFTAFLALHASIAATWTGRHDPWFLNSGVGVAVMVGGMVIVRRERAECPVQVPLTEDVGD